MKAAEKSFAVVLFNTLYKVVLTLSPWMKTLRVAIQMKAIDPYHSAAMLSLGGIKSCFRTASLGQTRIQGDVCRAKTKLFILLRLNMAAE